jgi:hypothetical protein
MPTLHQTTTRLATLTVLVLIFTGHARADFIVFESRNAFRVRLLILLPRLKDGMSLLQGHSFPTARW